MENSRDSRCSWQAISDRLEQSVPKTMFDRFVRSCAGHEWENEALVVAAPSAFAVDWLNKPLHLAMAQEALAEICGEGWRIEYRAMPGVASVPADQPTVVPEVSEQLLEPDQCPNHPEAFLRRRTIMPSLVREAAKTGDDIFYCTGDSGKCTWVYSRQIGIFIRPGLDEQSPLDMLRAYQVARRETGDRKQAPAAMR